MSYVTRFDLSLDISALMRECLHVEQIVVEKFVLDEGKYRDDSAPTSTKVYDKYNLFTFSSPEIQRLYWAMRDKIRAVVGDRIYVMQAWLNVFTAGQSLGKHFHWLPEFEAYHGYFCVNAEPSTTTYWLPNGEVQEIVNVNNSLVISKSDGDFHKTSTWENPNAKRITIAFDVVPFEHVRLNETNHWIPI